jgi:hypothetical protein
VSAGLVSDHQNTHLVGDGAAMQALESHEILVLQPFLDGPLSDPSIRGDGHQALHHLPGATSTATAGASTLYPLQLPHGIRVLARRVRRLQSGLGGGRAHVVDGHHAVVEPHLQFRSVEISLSGKSGNFTQWKVWQFHSVESLAISLSGKSDNFTQWKAMARRHWSPLSETARLILPADPPTPFR